MKILKAISEGIHAVSKALRWISGCSVLAMAVLCFIDVIARYIFKSPMRGTMEIIQVLMDIFVYAGLGMAIYAGKLISVPVLLEKMPNMGRGKIEAVGNFICAAMTLVIIRELMITTAKNLGSKTAATTLLHIPMGPIYLFTTICYGLICAELIIRGVQQFALGSDYQAVEEKKESEVC